MHLPLTLTSVMFHKFHDVGESPACGNVTATIILVPDFVVTHHHLPLLGVYAVSQRQRIGAWIQYNSSMCHCTDGEKAKAML